MSRVEVLDPTTLHEFLAADAAVLILTKTTCKRCAAWSEELESMLSNEGEFRTVRFGKLNLDQPGFTKFKKANTWMSEIDVLPFTVIFAGGELKQKQAGAGLDRLQSCLTRLLGA